MFFYLGYNVRRVESHALKLRSLFLRGGDCVLLFLVEVFKQFLIVLRALLSLFLFYAYVDKQLFEFFKPAGGLLCVFGLLAFEFVDYLLLICLEFLYYGEAVLLVHKEQAFVLPVVLLL